MKQQVTHLTSSDKYDIWDTQNRLIIKDIPWRMIRGYFTGRQSLFRHYQNIFIERYGREITGEVVELGGEKHYAHQQYFPRADRFVCTNIDRDYDEYQDITRISYDNDSVDNYLCVSVLPHVRDIDRAFEEIHRTLKPGGKLLLAAPFAFPACDRVDFWRLSPSSYAHYLENFEIEAFVHLGGALSTAAEFLKRPKGVLNGRYFLYKSIGFTSLLLARFLDRLDSSPIGYGVVARKRR